MKTTLLKLGVLATLVFSTMLFFACSKDDANSSSTEEVGEPPVGKWTEGSNIYIFKNDGTYTKLIDVLAYWDSYGYIENGTWSFDNTKTSLILMHGGNSDICIIQLMTENNMVVVTNNGDAWTFNKITDPSGDMVGHWTGYFEYYKGKKPLNTYGYCHIDLNEDGTFSLYPDDENRDDWLYMLSFTNHIPEFPCDGKYIFTGNKMVIYSSSNAKAFTVTSAYSDYLEMRYNVDWHIEFIFRK